MGVDVADADSAVPLSSLAVGVAGRVGRGVPVAAMRVGSSTGPGEERVAMLSGWRQLMAVSAAATMIPSRMKAKRLQMAMGAILIPLVSCCGA